jgi:catechol 2,3-dioxygenase-like lactoylglutathione lyase family enzyme
MARAILGLDHIMIAVHDLEKARLSYGRLGFTTAPIGHHQGKATSNYCIMFAETYLEIIGIVRPELSGGDIGARLKARGEGLHRMALGTPDADAAKADLVAAGLHPEGPQDLARPLESGEMVRFRNLMLPDSDTANLGLFLCGHKTPALMRPPELRRHANGAIAFAGVTAIVDDLEAPRTALTHLFGAASASPADYGIAVDTGRGIIHLATERSFALLHPGASLSAGLHKPSFVVLWIAVESLEKTAAALSQSGVPSERTARGLRVAPAHAHGVIVEFQATA